MTEKEKKPMYRLFIVSAENENYTEVHDKYLKTEKVYLIVDSHIGKLWMWNGLKANKLDYLAAQKYAKKLQAELGLKSIIEKVNQNKEPSNFPKSF
jgi:hypothetical protein